MGSGMFRLVLLAAAVLLAVALAPEPSEAQRGEQPAVGLCRSALQDEVAKSRPPRSFVLEFEGTEVSLISKDVRQVRGAAVIRAGRHRQAIEYECRVNLTTGRVPKVVYRPVEKPARRDGPTILYTDRYENRQYKTLSLPGFPLLGLSGTVGGPAPGAVVYGGKNGDRVAFRLVTENQWRDLPPAPFPATGIAGDAAQGPIVFGGRANRQVARVNLAAGPFHWLETSPAPFDVSGIAGFVHTGPMIFGGRNHRRVAYMKDYASGIWHTVADAPFPVRGISGVLTTGIMVFGGDGRQVAYMKDFRENLWHPVAPAPFAVGGLAGRVQTGPLVSELNGRRIAAMGSYGRNVWDLARIPPAPMRIDSISGEFHAGIILFSR